jgi:hypothetical protein
MQYVAEFGTQSLKGLPLLSIKQKVSVNYAQAEFKEEEMVHN